MSSSPLYRVSHPVTSRMSLQVIASPGGDIL